MKLRSLILLFAVTVLSSKAQTSVTLTANPNPFTQTTVVTFTATAGDTITIKIFNQLGATLLTTRTGAILPAGVYQDTIDMSNYPSGIYYVSAYFRYNVHGTAKLVKTGPVGIAVHSGAAPLKVFPNPFHDLLNIVCDDPHNDLILQNVSGELVYKERGSKQTSLDLTGIPAGLYFLRITTDKRIKTVKLLKE